MAVNTLDEATVLECKGDWGQVHCCMPQELRGVDTQTGQELLTTEAYNWKVHVLEVVIIHSGKPIFFIIHL